MVYTSKFINCDKPYKFVLLEALSATGLRSIRYAKEIPLVKSARIFIIVQPAQSAIDMLLPMTSHRQQQQL